MSLPEPDLFAKQLGDSKKDKWLRTAAYARSRLASIKNPYVGNKKKILVEFAEKLYDRGLYDLIKGGKVVDVFSGSAYISYLFKHLGAAVWSNDILASAFVNSVSYVDANVKASSEFLDYLCKNEPKDFTKRIIHNGYVPKRFTEEEANWLDRFRCNIENEFGGDISEIIRHIEETSPLDRFAMDVHEENPIDDRVAFAQCLASITLYVLSMTFVGGRLNGGQVLAGLEHRLKHVRNRGNVLSFNNILHAGSPVICNGLQCVSTRLDVDDLFSFHNPEADILYIDPPYGGEQSNYRKMYDFFEFWLGQDARPKGSDKFIMSKNYENSFMELLQTLPKHPIWIISYNESSWASIDKIVNCISEFKNSVTVDPIKYRYNYRKVRHSGIEYVVIAK